eukprot:233677-Pelagomonas_calceolata.AAC.7
MGEIIKCPTDKKAYRRITLPNGLGVLLISDPDILTSCTEGGDDDAGGPSGMVRLYMRVHVWHSDQFGGMLGHAHLQIRTSEHPKLPLLQNICISAPCLTRPQTQRAVTVRTGRRAAVAQRMMMGALGRGAVAQRRKMRTTVGDLHNGEV